MTNDQTTPLSKRILVIVGLLLVISAIGSGVIVLLRTIIPKPSAETSNVRPVSSPAEIIAILKTPGTSKVLEEKYQEQSGQNESSIIYTGDDRKYAITTKSKHTALFVAKTSGQTNDTPLIQEQLAALITAKGYEKTANTGPATSDSPSYVTFKSPISVCQLMSTQPTASPDARASHSLTCTDSTAISQEYSTIEMLLTLYKNGNEAPAFTTASRSTQADDNKALSLINLSGKEKPQLLLFAAIDNNWEYIGNLSGDATSDSNGKYSVSAETRAKINDTRYGGFLKRFVQ